MADANVLTYLDQSPEEQEAFLRTLSNADLVALSEQMVLAQRQEAQENQLWHYRCVNPRSLDVHRSTARQVIVKGGKRSSKTDTLLAELSIELTGIVPKALEGIYPKAKCHPPIRARVMCESLTDTLVPIIIPKLRWDRWNGTGDPGDLARGHWGWIPRRFLKRGSWEAAYSEKHRMLELLNGSTVQFLSYDQDPEAGEGASLHLVIHDEPPPRPWYMVNRMRTLDVKGQVFTGYTPPTEPDRAVKAAWIFDEVVCLGTPGPAKDPQVDTFTLWTEGNSILDAAAIQETVKGFSEVERRAILYGEETHLSGRVHPLFTAHEQWWCFTCNAVRIPIEGGICPDCLEKCEAFCHVGEDRAMPQSWPLYFVMDPHERRPCAMGWFRVTPGDDLILEQEGWVDGDVGDWKTEMDRVEKEIGREPDIRLCDPNPLDATDNRQGKGWTLRRELANHQIFVVPADDNFLVGRRRVDEYLTPDPHTRKPRLTIMRRCVRTVHAVNRYTWDEYVHRETKGPKGKPREEWKHYPDILRYLVMASPNYYISRVSVMPRSTAGRSKRTGY